MRATRLLPALLALVLLAGCGLFEVREPFEPIGDIERHIPNDPDSVLFNFEVALAYKSAGTAQFSETLASEFILDLDPADAIRLGFPPALAAIPKPDVERGTRDFLQLRVKNNRVRMTFDNVTVRPILEADLAFYDNMPYVLEIYNFQGGVEVLVERVAGTTDLFMSIQTNGNWAMTNWKDAGGDDPGETYGYYVGFYSGLTF